MPIQQMYQELVLTYEEQEVARQQELQRAQGGFIPASGAKIKCDYYVPKPDDPSKTERATIPAEALDWLIQKLSEQGSSQEAITNMNNGAQLEIAQELNRQGPVEGEAYGNVHPMDGTPPY